MALLRATANQLRATALLGLDKDSCEVTVDGRPFPIAGETFVAVWPGYWRDHGSNGLTLDEEYGVNVTVSLRMGFAPKDRVGTVVLANAGRSVLSLCERIRSRIHMDPFYFTSGLLTGATTWSNSGPLTTTTSLRTQIALPGQGFDFTAVGDVFDCTLTAWIYVNALDSNGSAALIVQDANNGLYLTNVAGSVVLEHIFNGSAPASRPITTGVWHHVGITCNHGLVTYYLDGVKDQTTTDGCPPMNFRSVGHNETSGDRLDGMVSDVRIYIGALKDSDMVLLAAGQEARYPPQSQWRLNDNSSSTPLQSRISGIRQDANQICGVTTNGFIEPLQLLDGGTAEYKAAWWYDAKNDPYSAVVQVLRFGKANRVQNIETDQVDYERVYVSGILWNSDRNLWNNETELWGEGALASSWSDENDPWNSDPTPWN